MANYTNPALVQDRCKRLPTFSTTSPATLDAVNAAIADIEAELDVALTLKGWATPVTTPANIAAWLRGIATDGVAATVLKSVYQEASGPNSESSWAMWERRYQAALKWIRDADSTFSQDAVANLGGGSTASMIDYVEVTPTAAQTLIAPRFTVDTTW